MKKLFFLSFVILIAVSAGANIWHEIEKNSDREMFDHLSTINGQTEISFALNGFETEPILEEGVEYQKIVFDSEGRFLEIGRPDLPVFTRMIAIPNFGMPRIEILDFEEEVFTDILVYPLQQLQKDNQPLIQEFTIDADYYQNGSLYPTEIVQMDAPAIMRGLRVLAFSIIPFRFDPQTNELRVITNINIRISTEGSGGENALLRNDRKLSRSFENIYKSVLLNYESLNLRNDHFQDPSYLFIHTINTQVSDVLSYLTEWKHQKGFQVATHAVNSGTGFSTIKSYIQTAYDTWENPPEFICLVGDAEGSFNIPVESGTNGDHGYVRLDGTDMLADAHIGRLSFSAISELQTIVYKILNYEKEPFTGQTDWYTKALLVGDPSSSGPSTIDVNRFIKQMIMQHNPSFQFTEAYSGSYSSTMSNTLNSGVSYFNYRGYIGMSGFDVSNINALTNGLMLPVAVFITCSTGTFASGTSRSEAFLRAGSPGNAKGAIAAIGTATSSTHTMFNNAVDAGIFYGLFAENNFNMGSALTRGKLHLYSCFYQQPTYVQNFSYWNNLMGDPGMELWSDVPQNLSVSYQDQVALGTNSLLVSVENDWGQPVEGAWVTLLMGDDEIFAFDYTNENGEVWLNISAQNSGSASLTVTKHNYIPHLGNIDIGQAQRFVNVESYLIDDDNNGSSSGNNNNQINPGETIELNLELKNHGTATTNAVSATISTTDDFVTIQTAEAGYGNIPSGNTAFATSPFVLSIAANALGLIPIHLQVIVSDALGNEWIDYIELPIQGANLYVVSYDFPNDPNGILQPGETAQLKLTIENQGNYPANAVYGELIADNSWLTIDDDEGYFGNIAVGSQSSNSANLFEITAHTQIIPGSQFNIAVRLYNLDGYDNIVPFLLTVGEASVTDPLGPDSYGYYCYDDGDVDYFNAPVYNWIDTSNGTQLTLNDPGDAGSIADITNLPITFRFYGIEYNSLTVCSNGWISPGDTDSKDYMNYQLPGPGGPSPMIAVFWDDLKTGNVKYLYDSAMNYLVITWNMLNDYNNDPEIFQAILYDANYYPTATGDSEIKFQYQVYNNTNAGSYGYPFNHGLYATIGLEDHTGTRGLQYTFNNIYPTQAKILANESAILFTGPPIQFDEPYLVLGGVVLNDANGNGLADYGETVDIEIMLNNLGQQPATGVSAQISAADPNITITQNVSNYNIVPGSGSATNLSPFTIEVSENCPDGHVVPFVINVSSDQSSWELYFTIELKAPIIVFNSIFVDDGDNNILDPGETADVFVYFENIGGASAYNLLTNISETDPYLTLNTSNHTFANISAGSISSATFNISASSTAPIGHIADVDWTMSGDLNYTANGQFSLVISQVPVMMEEDFSGTFPPTGWNITGGSNWQQGTGNYAGGVAPEARFYWSPSTTAVQRLISYPMNTSGSQSLQLSFKHNLDHYSGPYSIRVQTSSNGSTWNNAWSIENPAGNIGPELVQIDITTPDVGSANFQIAWVFDGYSWNINYWYVDDILLEGGQGAQLGFIQGNITLSGGNGNVQDAIISAGSYTTSPNASGSYVLPLPAGTYDMTVQLNGYLPASEDNVVVNSGQQTIVNFTLEHLASPINLSAEVSTNDVCLTWEMPAEDNILSRRLPRQQPQIQTKASHSVDQLRTRNLTGFRIFRDNSLIATIDNPSLMEYWDEFLASGIYTYFVRALYDNNQISEPSSDVEVEITLDPPQNLQAQIVGINVELNWLPPTDLRSLTSYKVYRDYLPIAEVTEPSCLDPFVPIGTHTYYVTAMYGIYESPASNEVIIEMTGIEEMIVPIKTELIGNYPNPFNPETQISFSIIEDDTRTQIAIYNLKGQKIKTLVDGILSSGYHTVNWNGTDSVGKPVASGVYLYKMQSAKFVQTKRMILMK